MGVDRPALQFDSVQVACGAVRSRKEVAAWPANRRLAAQCSPSMSSSLLRARRSCTGARRASCRAEESRAEARRAHRPLLDRRERELEQMLEAVETQRAAARRGRRGVRVAARDAEARTLEVEAERDRLRDEQARASSREHRVREEMTEDAPPPKKIEVGAGLVVEAARHAARSRVAALYTQAHGALAQLGERRLCKPEVTGSIPVRSTPDRSPASAAPKP